MILKFTCLVCCVYFKRVIQSILVATDGSLGSAKPDPKLAKVRANETKHALKDLCIPTLKLLKMVNLEIKYPIKEKSIKK